jgi:hypothetical protein
MDRGIVAAAIVPRQTPTPVREIKGDWFGIM